MTGSSRDVTVLGEALWDVYPSEPWEPGKASQSIRVRRHEQRCLGGAPANVAVTLSRLGLDVAMIATVGDDPLGEGLRDELAAAGVDTAHVSTVRARTGVTWVELGGSAPRYVPFRSPSADMLLDVEAIPTSLATRWLHLGSSSFARPSGAAAARLAMSRASAPLSSGASAPLSSGASAPLSSGASARVSLDLNVYPHLWPKDARIVDALADVLATAAVVKASEADLRALGLDEPALCSLRREHLTIVTRAERGATAHWGSAVLEHRPARPAHTIDPIGAGDAFMAGVLAVLVRHPDVERSALLSHAVSLGSQLGARAVGALGATTALADLADERRTLACTPSLR
jgi:sugar/nucleoside kinase (ribokinase family)